MPYIEKLYEGWAPTVPPPEVVEADINSEKGTIRADDFSAWTGTPDQQDIKVPPVENYGSDPNLNRGLGPTPKPRPRASKDPYAKRKAFFNQKPKLAPITETDSGGETDSARSSRTSAIYENVVVGMEKSKTTPIIEEELGIYGKQEDEILVNGQEEEDVMVNGEGAEGSSENSGRTEIVEVEEETAENGAVPEPESHDEEEVIGNVKVNETGDGGDEGGIEEQGEEVKETNVEGAKIDPQNTAYYQNVMFGKDGSMVMPLSDGIMPQNDLNKDNEEEGLYDFVGDNLVAACAIGVPEKGDKEKELNNEGEIKEKEDTDKEKNDEGETERNTEVAGSMKVDSGVGDSIINMEDSSGDGERSGNISPPSRIAVIPLTIPSSPTTHTSTSTGTHTMDIQTDLDKSSLFSKKSNDVINEDLRKDKTKLTYEIPDVETKDTGVGTTTDDLDAPQSYEDLQLEIEEATGILDEVVFGKGRSTQTGDSLRWGGERSNQIVQVMNRANGNNRPISECIVVDSTTNTLETVAIGSMESLAPSKAELTSAFSETNVSSLMSPSVMAEPQQRIVKSKKMIGLIVFFFVLILGIIAAGVVIYFVLIQNQNDATNVDSYYYLGMELRGVDYSKDLKDRNSATYSSYSGDMCTFVKQVYENSPLSSSYRDCSLMEFRQGDYGVLIVHLKLQFDRQDLANNLEKLTMSGTETMLWYMKYHLMDTEIGDHATSFNDQYSPALETLKVVKYVNQLTDFGSVPQLR